MANSTNRARFLADAVSPIKLDAVSATDYIEKVQSTLEVAHDLTIAIGAQLKKHGDNCVLIDGVVAACFSELKESIHALEKCDRIIDAIGIQQ